MFYNKSWDLYHIRNYSLHKYICLPIKDPHIDKLIGGLMGASCSKFASWGWPTLISNVDWVTEVNELFESNSHCKLRTCNASLLVRSLKIESRYVRKREMEILDQCIWIYDQCWYHIGTCLPMYIFWIWMILKSSISTSHAVNVFFYSIEILCSMSSDP